MRTGLKNFKFNDRRMGVPTKQPLLPTALSLVAGLAALVVVGCSASTGRGAATAAASCTGECLSGRDPYEAGCAADAVTTARAPAVSSSGAPVAVVELRTSAACQTSWARAVRVPGAVGTLVATVDARTASNTFEHATDGEVWTDMVPAANSCVSAVATVRSASGEAVDGRATSCREVAELARR